MNVIAPLRITPEDLSGLDKKTREGLGPLLEAINVFAQSVVGFAQAVPLMAQTVGAFSTDATGSCFILVKPVTPTKPVSVVVEQLSLPSSNGDSSDVTTVWAFSWQLIGASIRCIFIGLLPDTKYTFTLGMR